MHENFNFKEDFSKSRFHVYDIFSPDCGMNPSLSYNIQSIVIRYYKHMIPFLISLFCRFFDRKEFFVVVDSRSIDDASSAKKSR